MPPPGQKGPPASHSSLASRNPPWARRADWVESTTGRPIAESELPVSYALASGFELVPRRPLQVQSEKRPMNTHLSWASVAGAAQGRSRRSCRRSDLLERSLSPAAH